VTSVGVPGHRNSNRAMQSLSARRATRSVRLQSKSLLAKISSRSSRPQFHTRKRRRCRSSG
jgi:hypothetical protein